MVLRLAALTLLACAALAAPASASSFMDTGIADDRVLLGGTDSQALGAVIAWKALGIDTVRIQARWVAAVPSPLSATRPAGFDPADPASRGYNWGALDRAVNLVAAAGMHPILTVTGSGPLWGSSDPSQRNPRWKPSPSAFAGFATAVARRYGDRVDDYIIWNEPNLPLWIQPQSTCSAPRRCTPYAPHLYRRLVRAADAAIRAADPGARTMMGALAPKGTSGASRNADLRPLTFIRAMGCVDSRYRRIRTGACRGFQPASTYGFAYHPHGVTASPASHARNPDDAQMGDLPRLLDAIDRVTRAGGLRSRHPSGRFPLYLDEYGYETNPPDRARGVSTVTQSTYLQEAAYIAWANPRVRNLTQYAWIDEPLRSGGAGWQSGLLSSSGTPKAASHTFPIPFWAVRRSSTTVRLWGQVRPGAGTTVTLQRRTSTGRWTALTRAGTDPRGFVHRDIRTRTGGTYRFVWGTQTSSTRRVR